MAKQNKSLARKKSKQNKKSRTVSEARRTAVKEYQRERRRIRDIVKRAVSKGLKTLIDIPKSISIRSSIPTVSIKAQTRRLSEVTPNKLRSEGKLERAPKVHRTPKKSESAAVIDAYMSNDEGFLEQQRVKDNENLARMKRVNEYAEKFNEGTLILEKVEAMIQEHAQENPNAAAHLKAVLDKEIEHYGKGTVAIAMSEAPEDVIEAAQAAMTYGVGSGKHDLAMTELLTIIRGGEVPTADELDELQDALDVDAYFDNI